MTTASFDTTFLDHSDPRLEPVHRQMDEALHSLLARRDDRLLRDAGLTRDELLGVDGAWWHEHRRARSDWTL